MSVGGGKGLNLEPQGYLLGRAANPLCSARGSRGGERTGPKTAEVATLEPAIVSKLNY